MEPQAYRIIPTQSSVDWAAYQINRSHYGTISIKKGNISFVGDTFIGGELVIDVTTLKVLDITDPLTNYQFVGHLNSRDFFYTDIYPEAFLEITNTRPENNGIYHCDADLTIRGITNTIAFDLSITKTGKKANVLAKIRVDRTTFGMKFRSGNFFKDLGDNLIRNDFDLTVNLTAALADDTLVLPATAGHDEIKTDLRASDDEKTNSNI